MDVNGVAEVSKTNLWMESELAVFESDIYIYAHPCTFVHVSHVSHVSNVSHVSPVSHVSHVPCSVMFCPI